MRHGGAPKWRRVYGYAASMRTLLGLVLATTLVAGAARAQERECWTLSETKTAPYDPAAFDAADGVWKLQTGLGSVTFDGLQSARLERPDRSARATWSAK